MEYRTLGRTGVAVSPICLGTANFADPTPEAEAIRIVDAALDAGVNLIDTGDSYAAGESERFVGNALARNGRRSEVLVSTKVGLPVGPGPNDRGSSRLHVIEACEASLRRLRTDHIRPPIGTPRMSYALASREATTESKPMTKPLTKTL